jgi:hypothetical protein
MVDSEAALDVHEQLTTAYPTAVILFLKNLNYVVVGKTILVQSVVPDGIFSPTNAAVADALPQVGVLQGPSVTATAMCPTVLAYQADALTGDAELINSLGELVAIDALWTQSMVS